MPTRTIKTYYFNELSKDAKAIAIPSFRRYLIETGFFTEVFFENKSKMEELGFDNVSFNGAENFDCKAVNGNFDLPYVGLNATVDVVKFVRKLLERNKMFNKYAANLIIKYQYEKNVIVNVCSDKNIKSRPQVKITMNDNNCFTTRADHNEFTLVIGMLETFVQSEVSQYSQLVYNLLLSKCTNFTSDTDILCMMDERKQEFNEKGEVYILN